MMVVIYGLPELPRPSIDKQNFISKLNECFPSINATDAEHIAAMLMTASMQRHGGMLVVSANAKGEAERLQNQSTPVKPVRLTPELVKAFTRIDGAVLVDTQAVCHSIGVILDGLATKKGTPARGARYNSAIRYVETTRIPWVIAVLSEDRRLGRHDLPSRSPPLTRIGGLDRTILSIS